MCVYAYIMGTSKGQDPDKKKGENKMKTKKIRMLEVIECWGWVHGSGWSHQSDYDSKIVELTMDDIKHMDWDWIETDDIEYDDTDAQWRVTYYDLSNVIYDEDEDRDNIGNILSFHEDEIEEIAQHTIWHSELVQKRKDSNLISLPQYAKKHGLNLRSVQRKAQFGGFDTARKIGRNWVIDADEPYIDRRYKPES